jgi:hypothetical protein
VSVEDRPQRESDGSVWFEDHDGRTGWMIRFRVARVAGKPTLIELNVRPSIPELVPQRELSGMFLRQMATAEHLLGDSRVKEAFPANGQMNDETGRRRSRSSQLNAMMLARIALVHDAMAVAEVKSISLSVHKWLEAHGMSCTPDGVRRWVSQLRKLGLLDAAGRITETGRQFVANEFRGSSNEGIV